MIGRSLVNRCRQWVVSCRIVIVATMVFAGTAEMGLAQESTGTESQRQGRKLLLAHYMPWYQAKPFASAWGWHWTMNKFNPDVPDAGKSSDSAKRQIASHFYPLIGPYDSADPAVLECQLLQMKLAGIDGVIVDWYGLSDLYDYAVLHQSTQQLVAQAQKLGMRFAICYEDSTVPALIKAGKLTADQRVEHVVNEIAWLADNVFNRKGYVHLDGKPVFLSFGQGGLTDAEWTECLGKVPEQIAYFSEHQKRTSAVGAFDWPIPQEGIAGVARFEQNASEWPDSIAVVFPRFVDIYAQAGVHESWGRIEDQQGAVFQQTLRRAFGGPAKIIQIATWNDWGEGTNIEPSREFGYRDLETIQQIRKSESRGAFKIQAADLRLPVELLKRRRLVEKETSQQNLDKVAEWLSLGKVEQARRELKSVSAN
jgi:hypothetical protein